jgi:hypothetical protein
VKFGTMADHVKEAMVATAAGGYGRFEENGQDVAMPTDPGRPDEVSVDTLISTHQLIEGTSPNMIVMENDGSWRFGGRR